MFARRSSTAEGAPDISSAMSKPSTMPSCSWASRNVWPAETSTTRSAPAAEARANRPADMSVTQMRRAPAWRTTAVAMTPIGPAPVMTTSSPTTGHCRAVCVALPSGSNNAPRSGSRSGGCTHAFVAGMTT